MQKLRTFLFEYLQGGSWSAVRAAINPLLPPMLGSVNNGLPLQRNFQIHLVLIPWPPKEQQDLVLLSLVIYLPLHK